MQKQTEIVGKLVRSVLGDCQVHDSLLSISPANIAKTSLFLLGVTSSAIATSMAPVFHDLAALVHPEMAFRAVHHGVRHLSDVAEAS